jgi:ABC-type ATPase involved in cell division
MEKQSPVLEFREARLALEPGGGLTAPVALSLPQGSLVTANLRGPHRRRAFADAAAGLIPPAGGSVLFQGRDWREVSHEHAAAMRGRIGRLFAGDAWLPELRCDENILLGPRFHTRRPERALREEAARLALAFGLPGLPTARPEELPAEDLHRAGLVRAFLNAPALVVLEEPLEADGADLLVPLLAEIRSVRDRGGAVLWLTRGFPGAIDRALPTTARYRLLHGALLPAPEHAA